MEGDILINLGLTKDEANIYRVLIEGGFMPARTVAVRASLGRPLTYKILDDLIEKGVVEKKETGGKIALFAPVHPRELEKLFEKKREEMDNMKKSLEESLGSMISKYNLFIGKPNVQFFEGKEGVKKVLEDTLNTEGEILTYADIEVIEKYFKDINDDYVKKREKLNIKKRVLITENDFSKKFFSDLYNKNKEYFNVTDLKIVKTPINEIEGAVQIYENKIGIITISNENLIGIIVEDERINKLFKSMFEALYAVSLSFKP